MATLQTPFVETNALLAALQDDNQTLTEIVDGMTQGELRALRDALDVLDNACLLRQGELTRASWEADGRG